MYFHLILVTKYRKKVIDEKISEKLKEMFVTISTGYNIELLEWSYERDYVHILFKGEPNTAISKFINCYKSASSRIIKKEFPKVKEQLWKEYFWSRSFCILTTGGAPLEIIKKYIESQGGV